VKKLMIVTLLLMLTAGLTQAQGFKGSADVVKVTGQSVSAVAGARAEFTIEVKIDKSWHLYAHGDSNFIGMDLVADEGFPLQDLKVDYPHGHEGEFFGEKVMMISGKAPLAASALVPGDLTAGEHMLGFKVTAQACDDKTCLAPAYIPVTVKLTVE